MSKVYYQYTYTSGSKVRQPPYNIPAASDKHTVNRWEFDKEYFFDMGFKLCDLLAFDAPNMHNSILAPRHDVLGIWCEGAFNDWWLV